MNEKIGERLKDLREKKGYDAERLGAILGVSADEVISWEKGDKSPDLDTCMKLANLYCITLDRLVYSGTKNLEAEMNVEETDNFGQKKGISPWILAVSPVIACAVYLITGFTTERGWEIGWLVFMLVPILYSVNAVIVTKKVSRFAYSVFVAAIYVGYGLIYRVWHPSWVIFLTIPVFYSVCFAFERRQRRKKQR